MNWNALTPACWAIASMNKCDVSVAEGYIQANIREGRDKWLGAGYLPKEHRPIWPELGGLDALVATNEEYNLWRKVRQRNYKKLVELYAAEDYDGMVALMETDTVAYLTELEAKKAEGEAETRPEA